MPAKKVTKKQAIAEIIKCAEDPIYFLRKYATIYDEINGYVPFDMFQYQEDIIKAILKHRYNICLKARQLGITTTVGAFCAWLMLFHKGKNCLVICTKQETAKNTLRMAKRVIKNLPSWMALAKIDVNNRTSIELSNESRLTALTTSEDAGRSETVSFLFVDECAFIPNIDEIWTGLKPTLSTGGRVFLGSTPSGVGTFFHSTYIKARDGENNFNCRFGTYTNPNNPNEAYDDRLMWWVDPRRTLEWFKEETFGEDPRKIAQERLCNFNQSGITFVGAQEIERLEKQVEEPGGNFDLDRNLWIWDPPEPGGTYLIAVDISMGRSDDFSAFPVIKVNDYPVRVVAEYKGKMSPDQLGNLLNEIGLYYNCAMIAPENNAGWSGQTVKMLQDLQYPQIYFSRRRLPKRKDLHNPDPYYAALRNEYIPGYNVNSANRNHMLAKLEQAIRMGDLHTRSHRFLEEVKTFVVDSTNRAGAMRGYHDDLIMAYAGALWVRDEAFVNTFKSDEMTTALLDCMSVNTTTTQDVPQMQYNTRSHYDRARIVEHHEQQNKIKMADGSIEDLGWLLTSG